MISWPWLFILVWPKINMVLPLMIMSNSCLKPKSDQVTMISPFSLNQFSTYIFIIKNQFITDFTGIFFHNYFFFGILTRNLVRRWDSLYDFAFSLVWNTSFLWPRCALCNPRPRDWTFSPLRCLWCYSMVRSPGLWSGGPKVWNSAFWSCGA